ncbi:maltose alpha-D-glucosyltransferase [Azohydromonas lata]|uniref:maltose alpha-D-glucosyltransferase n=1 Tax=Azohydromonas lata TaxID=45677 RepID=A0ABU5IHE6_9BURK|nr:maltose alpha-D-glucosyltransferase [Azohydromonas lata]MDZ5458407.1 maltose alpha-D-glucosyltransferase [Azohydromonas lata]
MDARRLTLPDPLVQDAPAEDASLWYKDAVIYQLNVKAFFDSNDDGVGDFNGVTARLDYVKDLGVNTLWLMPFYPSPLRDDGYDIAEYKSIHPSYGTLDDFKRMLDAAHERGLRVITELVINHTSDQHPWFQRARRAAPGTPERDFYVWSETNQKYQGTRIIFTDTEVSNWTWDPVANAYFWHRFFSHQPDLNFDNPLVMDAVLDVMRFWLDMGVDGFRLDAIPYLVEREGTNNENLPETHVLIKRLRAALDAEYGSRFLLAEANQWPEDVREYFGDGDECHACYHFPLMPRMYMAIAQEDRFPVVEIMGQTPEIPANCQWVVFLRNHDELTLEMVTSRERDYMYNTYAADPQGRINVGIRRRLATLLDNDIDRIQLMNSLLMSMPGSPIVYYGDELGMGDNVYIGDRNGVRTPMQWSPDRNAGFSRADPQRLYLPPIMDAIYGYQAVNVESQQRDPSSLLHWMRRLLAVRQSTQAFGRGSLRFLKPGNRKVLAYLREHGDDVILCVANLARTAQPAELDLAAFKGRVPVEMMGRTAFPPIGELPYLLTLAAHGFYWFRLSADAEAPAWHTELLPSEELPVLVFSNGWQSLFADQVGPWRAALATRTRNQFETVLLPRFIENQRWYASKGVHLTRATLLDHWLWQRDDESWLIPLLELQGLPEPVHYFVPLSLSWEERDEERTRLLAVNAVARVRQQAQVGVMGDAFGDERFVRSVLATMADDTTLPTSRGRMNFRGSPLLKAYAETGELPTLPIGRPLAQSSNTIVQIAEQFLLKGIRRLRPGHNPELEVTRFLTEVAQFPHCAPLAGSLEYVAEDGTPVTLAVLQGYVNNQGDGWTLGTEYLRRHLELRLGHSEPEPQDAHAAFEERARTLGRRTAELHQAFALRTGNLAFDPEPLTEDDVQADLHRVRDDLKHGMDQLRDRLPTLPAAAQPLAQSLLQHQAGLHKHLATPALPPMAMRSRHHGDYHLGQVLVTKNDFVIIDFEGEPGRTLEERRAKRSPLRDVAGMLRSFDYAALSALRSAATSDAELQALAPVARRWQQESRGHFLRGYDEVARTAELVEAGGAEAAGAPLLALYELEKALYELRYELDNRPAWVHIPLQGLLDLAGVTS